MHTWVLPTRTSGIMGIIIFLCLSVRLFSGDNRSSLPQTNGSRSWFRVLWFALSFRGEVPYSVLQAACADHLYTSKVN